MNSYPLKRTLIGNEIYFSEITDKRFKTNRISVNLITELKSETACQNALVPFVLRKGYREFPSFSALNTELNRLYGAYLDADVRKIGDTQIINLSLTAVDDKYTLEGEEITKAITKILCGILTEPCINNGLFDQKEFELEKQNLIDTIQSEINEKRSYAINRMTSIMCSDEPYGLNKYGTAEQAKNLSNNDVAKAYENLLKTARIEILFVGCGKGEICKDIFAKAFESVKRENITKAETSIVTNVEKVKNQEDLMEVNQSKMVLGFRTKTPPTSPDMGAMRLMTAIYGGTPISKLFVNVREKLSLCYYCAARMDRTKGIMIVDCGVEKQNIEKAKEEILRQLDLVKQGEFSETEFDQAKLAVINSLKTVGDSLGSVEVWYLGQIFYGTEYTPQDEIMLLGEVSREQIMNVAQKIQLDTVYVLTSK